MAKNFFWHIHCLGVERNKFTITMEILNNYSFEKETEMLLEKMSFENNFTVSSYLENNKMEFGICSNCLNNSKCVWMQTKKIECEEYI